MGIEIIKDFFSDSHQITSKQQIIPFRRKLAIIITAFTVLIVIILGFLQDLLLTQVLI